jgi:hypothetical protein
MDGDLPFEDVASKLMVHPQLLSQVYHDRVVAILGGKGLPLQHFQVINEYPRYVGLACNTYRQGGRAGEDGACLGKEDTLPSEGEDPRDIPS